MGTTAGAHLTKQMAMTQTGTVWVLWKVNTPRLWCHKTRPIMFTLVVDNFGVKHVNKDDVNHLISSIKKYYSRTKDGWGTCTVGSNSIGIITIKQWIYPCQVISRKKITGIWAHHSQAGTDVTLLTQTKTIWHWSPSPPPPWHISKDGHKGYQTCPTNHWKYIILCMGCQHDCVESP